MLRVQWATQTDTCCQVIMMGLCPEGYQSSGTVVPNTACCKDLSKGISISSDMPYCPNTNPIGPNTTPKGFGPNGFDSGMSFPGMPDSAASTPGGGYKTHGY